MDKSFKLKVKTDEKSLTKTSGRFTIQPLDRGYGIFNYIWSMGRGFFNPRNIFISL